MSLGVEVHHRADGPADADAIVLVNSLATTLDVWDGQVRHLAERFRVVRYDLRGHGSTPAGPLPFEVADLGGDLVALLDRLGVDRAHVCGLSLGGQIAMWVAANRPERVRRLVLCSTAPRIGTAESWARRAEAVRTAGMGAVADTVLAIWFTGSYRGRDPHGFARMEAMLRSMDPEAYAACCDALGRSDLRSDLADISAATLVVAGAEDPSTPPEVAEETAGAIPDARVRVIEGAAHIVNVERPDETTGAILDHLGATTGEEP